ncbi:MAG: hypothetical protein ACOH2E_05130 [Candidatus Paracaedibacter sp.]
MEKTISKIKIVWGRIGFLSLFALLLCYMGAGQSLSTAVTIVNVWEDKNPYIKKVHKKKKHYKSKKRKLKKRKAKKGKSKGKVYSAQKIEKLLQNDSGEEICNRLNCASNLKIAKSCLPTKASYRSERKCFRAFCAYGCNEEDYNTKPEVHDFCNITCSSKKYSKKAAKY